jgi:predicted metal-dependent hydrolase
MTGHDKAIQVIPRKFSGDFPQTIPAAWFKQNPILSNMLNTYTVLVPDNENYYIRNIRRSLELFQDGDLSARVQGFIRQEGQHGIAHRRFWSNLSAQGLKFEAFLGLVNFLGYKFVERFFPLSVQLSIIAAIEHINAYMGHIFLADKLLEDADLHKRLLFGWHFAEEIEHKEVSYDVFQKVSGNYFLRIAGMLLTAPLFYGFNLAGTIYFSWQQGRLFSFRHWCGWFSFLFWREKVAFKSLYQLLLYFRPGFHPRQIASYRYAEEFLNSAGFQAVSAAYTSDERLKKID